MNKRILIITIVAVLGCLVLFSAHRIVAKGSGSSDASVGVRSDAAEVLLSKAKKALGQNDEDAAVKELEAIMDRYGETTQAESAVLLLAPIYEKRRDLMSAKELYKKFIERFPSSGEIANVQEALDSINVKILFSSVRDKDSIMYEVQKGDTLTKIAKKFNTTTELITRSNNIKNDMVRLGQRLKVVSRKFSIVVDKSQNILTLKSGGEIIKTYKVSTGKDFCTPTGDFKIVTKIINPPWYPPDGGVIQPGDPRNLLGSRWLGISREGYGIHGTIEPETIGKNVTEGCVRMKNSDVEELYSIVPEGTEVVIID